MSLSVHESVQLVWAIANTEANLCGEERIRPLHFFLGVLKVADSKFTDQLQGVELPEATISELKKQAGEVRHYLELTPQETTRLRRSVRADLRSGREPHTEMELLHRSEESRTVFRAAAIQATAMGAPALSVVHLATALFEVGGVSFDKLRSLKNRPSSKSAKWEVGRDGASPHKGRFHEWYGRNLSALAATHALPQIVGRDKELRSVVRILSRTSTRHVLIVGEPGVGKTALVEGLAQSLQTSTGLGSVAHLQLLELHGAQLLAGCRTEATLEKRLIRVFQVLSKASDVILFLDNLDGFANQRMDLGSTLAIISAALSQDHVPCIATTTPAHYEQLLKTSPTFCRRFQVLRLEPPSASACRLIVQSWVTRISGLQHVVFKDDAVDAAIELANRHLNHRSLPDRFIDLIENAATFVKVSALSAHSPSAPPPIEVTRKTIESVLAEHYGVVIEKAPRNPLEKI
jgi:ATP-dependent Clp protease ATP-binding subunit ClpA